MDTFNGLGLHLGNLSRLSKAKSRSISPENFSGEKGAGAMAQTGPGEKAARDLGRGWKVSPYVPIQSGEEKVLAEIEGPGAIQQIWMTPTGHFRHTILRFYWDDQETPSIECPIGDFFAHAVNEYSPLSSLAVCVNPRSGLNCYWEMPFRRKCRITATNIGAEQMLLFYQINYALTDVPDNCAYFHAQFRRTNPLPYKTEYCLLDGVRGQGHYVGTYMFWGVNNSGWWGEGEIKFFLDGDEEFPTICGTGTEDYFCGSYNFDPGDGYREYSTPYAGLAQVLRPDGIYKSQMRFGMYRWHIPDPIRFETDLRVQIQALGWRSGGRYLPLQDDISSVAFWYQTLPTAPFPTLPDKDELEII
jgi:hypothetical protein